MKILTLILFYSYVWALIVFGGVCVFTAKFDQQFLDKLNTDTLEPRTATSLLSQYRFSRAIECGFGVFSFTCRRAIFERRFFNRLFLGTMLGGVIARMVSLVLDGQPFPIFYAFLLPELIGVIFIFLYTRATLKNDE